MQIHLEDISFVLNRETDNRNDIFLYPRHEGKAWVAYEQSAHNLHLLMPCIPLSHRRIKDVPLVVTMITVPQLSLDFLIETGVYMSDCDGGRNLKLRMPRSMTVKVKQLY